MMKKVMVIIVAILWVIVGIQYFGKLTNDDETLIIEAFNETNFEKRESHIEAYGKYEKEYLSLSAREDLLKNVATNLGIKGDYEIVNTQEEIYEEITLYKRAKYAEARIKLITIRNEEEKIENVVKFDQYLLVEIALYDSLEHAMAYKDKVDEIYEGYNIKVTPTINLKASYVGELSLEEKNKIADTFLNSIDATIVSEHRSSTLYTIYGYTDLIKESSISNNEKINVNIAMNYDEEEDNTFLYLSTPIISEDY